MAEFLLGAALFVLGTVALGLVRILRGPEDADRMLAAQLLGSGGVASLLLLGVANGVNAVGDLALLLALLAAFASVAFVTGARRPDPAALEPHAAPDAPGARRLPVPHLEDGASRRGGAPTPTLWPNPQRKQSQEK